MAKKIIQIPFDNKGNQLHFPEMWAKSNLVMLDNYEFTDTLNYIGYFRGRSAAVFEFKREMTGTNVTMFMKDLDESLKYMVNGKLSGTFTFCKRGMNFGVTLLKPATKFTADQLLESRDKFIADRGLWSDYVNSLE